MDDEQFAKLLIRLDTITKLLAANLPQEMTVTEKIILLLSVGLRPVQIANILGTTPKYVSVVLDRAKKAKKRAKSQGK